MEKIIVQTTELKLDKLDLKILKLLQENGKISNLQLSSEIGLSPAPTLERVKKLENANIIKSYHASVNEAVLGLGVKAFIQISLVRQIDNVMSKFKDHINEIDEVVECFQVTGNFDYLLKVFVKDIPAFEKLIGEKLSKVEEIRQMQTTVILSQTKNSKVLPAVYE
ncbi:MAG: Lrp/AsnC ligand binding domain-containing protein [Proteobacteria bacterium]|nr:Lrp/AsnC ligand binding domain-containing protein [Pseudomonadota bacterium]